MPKLTEGKVTFTIPDTLQTRRSDAFYNPNSALQRDICIAVLKALNRTNLKIADVFAGSGIRSARLLKELPKEAIRSLLVSDASPSAVAVAKKNVRDRRAQIIRKDARTILLTEGFDYIDLDPFGSPALFLDAAAESLARKGILGVTATDLAALSGAEVHACLRNYWARPLKGEFHKELSSRMLIRRIQLACASHDKCVVPIYVHAVPHYVRVYLQHQGADCAKVFQNEGFIHYCFRCCERRVSRENAPKSCCGAKMSVAGPLWIGPLWDAEFAQNVAIEARGISAQAQKTAAIIAEEAKIPQVTFYNVAKLCEKRKIDVPRIEEVLKSVAGARTHFSSTGIRSAVALKEVLAAISRASSKLRR